MEEVYFINCTDDNLAEICYYVIYDNEVEIYPLTIN